MKLLLALWFVTVAVCSGTPTRRGEHHGKAALTGDNYDANFGPTLPRPPQPEKTALEIFVTDGIQFLSNLISNLPDRVLDLLPFQGAPANNNEDTLKKVIADPETNEFKQRHLSKRSISAPDEDEAAPAQRGQFLRDFTNLRSGLRGVFTREEDETQYQRDQRLNQALMGLIWLRGDREKLKSPMTQSFLRTYWNPRWKPVKALIDENQALVETDLITSKLFTDAVFQDQTADLEEPEKTKKVLTALYYSTPDLHPIKQKAISWEVRVIVERVLGLEDWLHEFIGAANIRPLPRQKRHIRPDGEAPAKEGPKAGQFVKDFQNLRRKLHESFTPGEDETPYQRDQRLNQALMGLIWITGDQEKLKSPLTQSFLRTYWNPRWKPVKALIDENQAGTKTDLITSKLFTDAVFQDQAADLEEPEKTKKVLTALYYGTPDMNPMKIKSTKWEAKTFIAKTPGLDDWLDEFVQTTRIGPLGRGRRSERAISSDTDKKVKKFWEKAGTKTVDGIVRQLDHVPRILGKLSPWSGNTNEKVWWRS